MKTIKLLLLSSVALLVATTSCIDDFTIHGNGVAATEGRITTGFNQVKSEGAFEVHITSGNDYDILVNAESNILPYIETDVNNHTLRIYIRGIHNVRNQLPMEVFITTPHLEGITQSGSGIVTSDFFNSDHFNAVISGSGSIETAVDASTLDALISGSGNLTISGTATNSGFTISGSGKILADNLDAHACSAKISGSGSMWVNVENYLKANISGSGNVFYKGAPDVEKHISGSGNVIQN
ncbi:MAG TPA: head GIN domain-containing protein [Draconibacterium sp.]|nr:head GIN domain-containing protein [Draconibacterium sp.]